ncbi:CopG family transcriptional regulator [bacterium]|nr:CopG family transcriptional regulator [bacterium]
MKRIGVIGIVVSGDRSVTTQLQSILSDYGDIIAGRMGVPMPDKNISAISVIVSGCNERITALTGKIGRLNNINVKSALTSIELED